MDKQQAAEAHVKQHYGEDYNQFKRTKRYNSFIAGWEAHEATIQKRPDDVKEGHDITPDDLVNMYVLGATKERKRLEPSPTDAVAFVTYLEKQGLIDRVGGKGAMWKHWSGKWAESWEEHYDIFNRLESPNPSGEAPQADPFIEKHLARIKKLQSHYAEVHEAKAGQLFTRKQVEEIVGIWAMEVQSFIESGIPEYEWNELFIKYIDTNYTPSINK